MSDDPQDVAEALDEDKADDIDDLSGDAFGDDLPGYPPDRPMGVNTVGVTAIEADAGESLAERALREEPDALDDMELGDTDDSDQSILDHLDDETDAWREIDVGSDVGQLVDLDVASLDEEPQLMAEALSGEPLTAEESAMHIEDV